MFKPFSDNFKTLFQSHIVNQEKIDVHLFESTFCSFPMSMSKEETVSYCLKVLDGTYKIYTNLFSRARRFI